jgi:hypothetical protein
VKLVLKGKRFSNISDIKRGVTEQLKVISLRAFEDMYKRSQRSVDFGVGGGGSDFVEIL